MASIKKLDERRYKITVSNGYRPNGKKISKAKTIQVPPGVPKRGIGQYVAHAAEELERSFKTGYAEDGEMTFEEFASRWLNRQTKYAPSTIAAYRRMLEGVPSAHPAALLRDIAAALRRGQTDGGRPRGSCGHRLSGAHLLPPPAGAEGAGGRLHAHHAPSGRRTDLQSRRRLFSEAAQRMIVAFVEIHFSKKIVIALPPRLRYVVLAK